MELFRKQKTYISYGVMHYIHKQLDRKFLYRGAERMRLEVTNAGLFPANIRHTKPRDVGRFYMILFL